MITDKIWGKTELLTPEAAFCEIHRLSILPYSYCSFHMHEYKWNAFIVISGKLIIEQEIKTGEKEIIELSSGDFLKVRPKIYHRFSTNELPTIAFEIYYPESLAEDIIRRDIGGRRIPTYFLSELSIG